VHLCILSSLYAFFPPLIKNKTRLFLKNHERHLSSNDTSQPAAFRITHADSRDGNRFSSGRNACSPYVPRYRYLLPSTRPILASHLPLWWCLQGKSSNYVSAQLWIEHRRILVS